MSPVLSGDPKTVNVPQDTTTRIGVPNDIVHDGHYRHLVVLLHVRRRAVNVTAERERVKERVNGFLHGDIKIKGDRRVSRRGGVRRIRAQRSRGAFCLLLRV